MPGNRMTFKQRVKLQVCLENYKYTLTMTSRTLGLSRSTIFREIINRRISYGSRGQKFMHSKPYPCEMLKKFPFCCNVCFKRSHCSKEIFIYDAYEAQSNFERIKHECAKGPHISDKDLIKLDELVSPRIQCGQSIYHVVTSDEKIKVCEHTIRRYIQKGYMHAKVIDLPRTVQRVNMDFHPEKKRTHVDVKLLNGRMYDDYLLYRSHNQDARFIQIDTVIGKRSDHKCILTIYEPLSKLQFGILISKSSSDVNETIMNLINKLKSIDGLFFNAILTDNGFEFKDLPQIEVNETGEYRFHLFYCDPYASYQKGACERNHEFFRYLKKKGISFDNLSQVELDSIFSNINSYKRKSLNGLSPYDVFAKSYGIKTLEAINIQHIEPLKIILKQ